MAVLLRALSGLGGACGNGALACRRQPGGAPGNPPASHAPAQTTLPRSVWPVLHRRQAVLSAHGHGARHLSVAAAANRQLPRGGWVPQLPPHPQQPPDLNHSATTATPQPQRRRPPLQRRILTVPLPTPVPKHQKPQPLPQQQQSPQHAQEYRLPPPGVPPAPHPQRAQQQRWPRLDYLVVVEGSNDAAAVHAATDSQVFVLGGALHAADGDVIDAIRQAAFGTPRNIGGHFRGIIALMDPDNAGRQARNLLDAAFPGKCWHAFIPASDATAQLATKNHKSGNVGVEHAAPDAIQRALASARVSSPGRREFERSDLIGLHLVTEMGSQEKRSRFAPVMRELVGRLLGIGMCDGKQLAKQLNLFGFTHGEVATATRLARALLAGKVKEQRERLQRQQGAPQRR